MLDHVGEKEGQELTLKAENRRLRDDNYRFGHEKGALIDQNEFFESEWGDILLFSHAICRYEVKKGTFGQNIRKFYRVIKLIFLGKFEVALETAVRRSIMIEFISEWFDLLETGSQLELLLLRLLLVREANELQSFQKITLLTQLLSTRMRR